MTDHDDALAGVHLYFDGELAPEEQADVLAHLATCARCQAELSDLAGLNAALSRPPREAQVVPIRRRRAWIPIAVASGVAAAAAIAVAVWPRGGSAPAIALGPTRAIEARFDAEPFAAYRPYAVVRGAPGRESIALDALAELERRGDWRALIAALAVSGDLARAAEVAAKHEPPAVDRAAIALASGDAERALEVLDDAPETPGAAWNHALAARELGLGELARANFSRVVAANEPGWRDEAARQVAALDDARAVRAGLSEFQKRGLAMIAGTGPAITAADVARYPASSRIYFHDALRVAGDAAAVNALRPIADALDRATSSTHARAAIDRVVQFKTRAPFAARYRALVAHALDPAATVSLVDDLARAGHDVDDLLVGAIILAGQTRARLGELTRAAPDDPWFHLVVQREQLAADRARDGSAAVVGRLRAAADACPASFAYRCAQLALDAAEASVEIGAADVGETYARRAHALYATAVAPAQEDRVLAYLGELERHRDRVALARATFLEVELHAPECALDRYAKIGRAKLAVAAGRFGDARQVLPSPDACGAPPDELALSAAVDLARETGDAVDVERARAWIAAASSAGDPRLATLAAVGRGRLDADLVALQAIARRSVGDLDALATRAWATAAIVDIAAERGAWADAAEAARAEVDAPALTGCTVVASVDGERRVVAARGRDGRWIGSRRRAPIGQLDAKTFVPADVIAALAGCEDVDVIARPPLHGRTELLPPSLPWAFVGGGARPASRPAASRTVIVADAVPPDPAFRLPRLAPTTSFPPDAVVLRFEVATPARVLAAIADATYVELDAHGIAEADVDAAFLALSPEPSGRFTLSVADLRAAKLHAAPVVVLAACRGARVAPYLHRRWSLPDAFLAIGARAVIATDVDVPDPDAPAVFGAIRERIARGESPAAAVAAVRGRAEPGSWITRIAVFR